MAPRRFPRFGNACSLYPSFPVINCVKPVRYDENSISLLPRFRLCGSGRNESIEIRESNCVGEFLSGVETPSSLFPFFAVGESTSADLVSRLPGQSKRASSLKNLYVIWMDADDFAAVYDLSVIQSTD